MAQHTPRTLHSEYVEPKTDNFDVWRARILLIEATKHNCPKFLRKLSKEVFPFYRVYVESGCGDDRTLETALSKWAAEFNADHQWLRDWARHTLAQWHGDPTRRRGLSGASLSFVFPPASVGEQFEFHHEGWQTVLLTWPGYKALVRQRFEEKLLEYQKKTSERATLHGLVRARRQYSRKNIDWFVLFQLAKVSPAEIARRVLGDRQLADRASTVRKGIKTAGKLLNWGNLRKGL